VSDAGRLLTEVEHRLPGLLEEIEALVAIESPSSDREATAACGEVFDRLVAGHLGTRAVRRQVEGTTHLWWRFGPPNVVLVGHLDTVWPHGTVQRRPFRRDGDTICGPGVFDMKTGLVQAVAVLSLLTDLDGVGLLVTADEEIGSPTSRELILDIARDAQAVLVLEGAAGSALKTERKGLSRYGLVSRGRAAHTGLDPERGANALVELAHQVLGAAALSRPDHGTIVTPTVAHAGTASNVVAAHASLELDVRAATLDEQRRVDEELRRWAATVPDVDVEVEGAINRQPMMQASTRALLDRAQAAAADLGIDPLDTASVGGVSDANIAAEAGTPVLDGLGAVGGGAHAEDEHVLIDYIPERVALVTVMVEQLLARPIGT